MRGEILRNRRNRLPATCAALCTVLCIVFSMTFLLSSCGKEDPPQGKDAAPVSSNAFLAGTAWIAGDESYMIFYDEKKYAWYQTQGITDDNYFAGRYRFYMGEEALKYLTTDLSGYGVTESEIMDTIERSDLYTLDTLVCLTAINNSFMLDGEEQLDEVQEISYFGFLLEDGTYFDIANMNTGTYYEFTKEQAE